MPREVEILLYGIFRTRLGRDYIRLSIERAEPLSAIISSIPELKRLVEELDREGVPYGILVDGRNVMLASGLDTVVEPGSKVKLFTYVSGGSIETVWDAYQRYRGDIERAIKSFREVGRCGEERIFFELVFCLLTPMSPAIRCWEKVKELHLSGTLYSGGPGDIGRVIRGCRFWRKKSQYIVGARRLYMEGHLGEILSIEDPLTAREMLVRSVKGLGYKEASHFLRNIGRGLHLAILDRHILRWMARLRLINSYPKSLSRRRYIELETRFRWLARYLGMLPAELDLLLWAMETGIVFK